MSEQVNTAALILTREQLEDVRAALAARIREGLDVQGAEIQALPSFYAPPRHDVRGQALVIDTGGTNMRAAVVEMSGPGKARVISGPVKRRLSVRAGKITAEAFFLEQAELAKTLDPPRGLPVGYCFSYPSEIQPNRDGRLIRWTKSIDIPGVAGTLVGERLGAALREVGLAPKSVRVLNDTVAGLLGGALMHPELPADRFIGLIVGTGTNMAGFFGADRSKKIPATWTTKMSVNLESGNFSPPHLTPWDDALDRASDNIGAQRFEKAVAGYYLPHIFARMLPNHPGFDPAQGCEVLVQYRDSGLEASARAAASALLTRSADLVAASLAALLDLYGRPEVPAGVLAEGTLFWSDPLYAPRVLETLARITGVSDPARLYRVEDANLLGSAAAAVDCDP